MFRLHPLLHKRSVHIGLFLLAGVFLALLLRKQVRPVSSEQNVLDQTLRALENGDTQTLCRLADQKEVAKLRLTPENVRAFLQETLWQRGVQRVKLGDKETDASADQAIWKAYPEVKGKTPILIFLLANQDGSYHLVLSRLLWGACWYKWGRIDVGVNYIALAKQCGIEGLRGSRGGYVNIQQFSRDAEMIKKQAGNAGAR